MSPARDDEQITRRYQAIVGDGGHLGIVRSVRGPTSNSQQSANRSVKQKGNWKMAAFQFTRVVPASQ